MSKRQNLIIDFGVCFSLIYENENHKETNHKSI